MLLTMPCCPLISTHNPAASSNNGHPRLAPCRSSCPFPDSCVHEQALQRPHPQGDNYDACVSTQGPGPTTRAKTVGVGGPVGGICKYIDLRSG